MNPWPLSIAFPLTVAGSVALILVYDVAAASFAVRRPSFRYARLWPLQLAIYVVIGFFAMLALLDIRLVEIAGAVTGFVEGTVGWAIAWRIGPARRDDASPATIAIVVVWITSLGFGLAIVGALLFNVVARALLHARDAA